MTVANTIVLDSLELIGANSPLQQPIPQNINKTFTTLQKLLNEWQSKQITITGLVIPVNLGTDLEEPDDSYEGIIYNLAVRAAPKLQKIADQQIRGLARAKFQDIYNLYGPNPLEIRKDTLPIGQANKQFYPQPVFYAESTQTNQNDGLPPQYDDGD